MLSSKERGLHINELIRFVIKLFIWVYANPGYVSLTPSAG